MADPQNPARIGEQWNPYRLAVLRRELDAIHGFGVISGGWAWHLLSPPHIEAKVLHDHKDIDLFVYPQSFASLMVELELRGYERSWTRFDDPSAEFIRFTRYVERACPLCLADDVSTEPLACPSCGAAWASDPCEIVKVILDLFVREVPSINTAEGYAVVEPATMLSFYGNKHSSEGCVAVLAARELVARGESVPGNLALVGRWAG